ncbi:MULTISPECIES: tRNA (cytosine(32)/uridine(32)-2'-O)-methyltransferase TrmJ [unclassified Vibrio]|uniref:tRNA (cytosine(32)/uridine(32)-2'-O)-methyltransferase TrmJ n=1 Tax=unclassified Vibrio TaxID=2614977 RepID=UPI0014837BF1|nr:MULTISPECIES: tRNA (cytosine(32)/uridine(32)-2'-O)-methyltransferase TrmJ [unclassified Vibrio]MDQ2191892.1 tRNA (cytosine(32)/uridine(32)-2'-O)-methyltransferase TrmJ [Vibrio sp. A14(2019)]MDQ2195626.1 tRNA (cytosine(32)/uridine(32)-2'-O)-methyltransferase TrmJ [Vibrio sp. 2017_1457_11]NNN76938.1 tRNA (cytosine(32)/uridine(32)-2'-O)-methyltransferase TrmJ [Vibrio sp. B7]NNN93445.1 tRNA (cytosine(32)/uridine(32)-2'-O)-methyltransferase TrmJ [Vibrio sp. B8-1]NNO06667.1 tRNA (cytosine(32)/uri
MLDNVKIILVGTSHSGNIGSAARAMKVMGLSKMILVSPLCEVDAQAIALAAGASDIALNAEVVDTLEQAVADCGLVVGSSARSRTLEWPMLEPRECGEKLAQEGQQYPVALVFGREKTGLTNDELQKCHFHVCIPANPEYSSLNLAMAVQTLSYEVRVAYLNNEKKAYQAQPEEAYPLHHELEMFYQHLEKVMIQTQFISKEQPGQIMNKLRRLFSRSRPESQEINILRGVLTSIEKHRSNQ